MKDENIRLATRLKESQRQIELITKELDSTRQRIEMLSREVGRSYHEGYMDARRQARDDDQL